MLCIWMWRISINEDEGYMTINGKKYPELTTEQIDRVKTLYEKDYQYGWANIS